MTHEIFDIHFFLFLPDIRNSPKYIPGEAIEFHKGEGGLYEQGKSGYKNANRSWYFARKHAVVPACFQNRKED
jgi:hypothetical protein